MYWRGRSSDPSFAEARLERQAEADLVRRFHRQGDTAARNKLVISHLMLVWHFARYYAKHGSTYDDLSQEGSLALLRATETFAPDRGVRFATYAAFWIRARMQRNVAQCRSHWYTVPAYQAYATNTAKTRGAKGYLIPTQSLDAPTADKRGTSFGEGVADPSESVESQVSGKESRARLRAALDGALDKIDDRRASLVCEQRLLRDEPETLEALGAQLNLSREGVRLLELRVKRELKRTLTEQTP